MEDKIKVAVERLQLAADMSRWPKYKAAYLRAFGKMLEARRARGLETTLWARRKR